jgi:large subunit ribosomal protein L15
MAIRFRKSRRQRGSRYCGWGQVGQHRAAGSRGGVGGAGKHKHFFMRTNIEEPNHFGHTPFNSFNRDLVQRWVNIRDLDAVFAKYGKTDESGRVVLDLTSLGYDKLLGGGSISGAYTVRVAKVSESARSKIEAAGGGVIADEQHDNK